jgi:large subunit ribosomal protein L22
MGERKRISAEKAKEAKKTQYFARLNNCPTSPRKMRLVADQIRGMNVDKALFLLKTSSKEASGRLHKLLLSAISNWQAKNEGVRIEDSNLIVKKIFVDSGRQLKRIQAAPQGRAHRLKKRSNHVTLFVDSRVSMVSVDEPVVSKEVSEEVKTTPVAEKIKKTSTSKPKAEKPKTEKPVVAKKKTEKTKSEKPKNEKKETK